MAISKGSLLSDSNRYFILSICRYQDKRPSGLICHDSLEGSVAFFDWVDLVYKINDILDALRCPISNMEQRSFQLVQDLGNAGNSSEESLKTACNTYKEDRDDSQAEAEKITDFRLYIRYRYNTSWQGQIISLKTGNAYDFASFLELALLIDYDLDGSEADLIAQPGSQIHRIAVKRYLERFRRGSVHYLSLQEKQPFINIFDLIQKVEGPIAAGNQEKLISGELVNQLEPKGKRATFVIRMLFREHATWQGVICWRETGQKVNFRSFLEMLILMDRAAAGYKDRFCADFVQEVQEEDLCQSII